MTSPGEKSLSNLDGSSWAILANGLSKPRPWRYDPTEPEESASSHVLIVSTKQLRDVCRVRQMLAT